MLRVWAMVLILASALTGCASTGVSPTYTFTQDSEKGLVIVGMQAVSDFPTVYLRIAGFDPVKGGTKIATFGGNATIDHDQGANKQFYLLELSPGQYVFQAAETRVVMGGGGTTYLTCLAEETYGFEVEAGLLQYAGDVKFTQRGSQGLGVVTFEGFSQPQIIEQFLEGYPNVSVRPDKATLIPASFPRGRSLLGARTTCGGYYQEDKNS